MFDHVLELRRQGLHSHQKQKTCHDQKWHGFRTILPQKGMRCEWGRAPIQSETTAALRPTTVLILIDPDDFERYQL